MDLPSRTAVWSVWSPWFRWSSELGSFNSTLASTNVTASRGWSWSCLELPHSQRGCPTMGWDLVASPRLSIPTWAPRRCWRLGCRWKTMIPWGWLMLNHDSRAETCFIMWLINVNLSYYKPQSGRLPLYNDESLVLIDWLCKPVLVMVINHCNQDLPPIVCDWSSDLLLK